MIKVLFLFAFLVFCNNANTQQSECKVIPANISGSYSGGCKNGLANGKGIAQGVDRYEGRFKGFEHAHRIFLPNADCTSSTANSADWFRVSMMGFTSTSSSEDIFFDSATISMMRWASR